MAKRAAPYSGMLLCPLRPKFGSVPKLTLKSLDPSSCDCRSSLAVSIESSSTGLLSYLHQYDPLAVPMAVFAKSYLPRHASFGALDLDGDSLDPLSSLGTMICDGLAFQLWGDVDGEPRGWESVPSLPAAAGGRWADTESELLIVEDSPRGFDHFAAAAWIHQAKAKHMVPAPAETMALL